MSRIRPLDKSQAAPESRPLLEAAERVHGEPSTPAGIQAICPPILEASRALGAAPHKSGLLTEELRQKIQEVVDEKADVVDVRMATIIDLLYAVILYVFKVVSQVPMSTTWVFVGLLAGRELAAPAKVLHG